MKTFSLRDPAFVAATAGGSSPYTALPTDYAGLLRWYRASDYEGAGYSDGDDITTDMVDQSGNGADAVPDVTNPPIYKDTILSGGMATTYFNGTAANLDNFAITQINLDDFTVIALLVPTTQVFVMSKSVGNVQLKLTGSPVLNQTSFYPGANPTMDTNAAAQGINAGLQATVWQRDSGTGVGTFYVNKTQMAEKDGQTNTTQLQLDRIGTYNLSAPGQLNLAELCIYSNVMSQANWEALYDGYFAIKYAADI